MTGRVRLPVDTELPDRIAFGLTARQLAILALTAIGGYMVFAVTGELLPTPAGIALAVPVVGAGALLAVGHRDGLPADLLALAAGRFLTTPRTRVLAPEGIPAQIPNTPAQTALSPLDLPVSAVFRSGLVALTTGGFCVLLRASAAGFALRSDDEQEALVEGFGRFLNGLTQPAQIVVRSEPVDLHSWAQHLTETVPVDAAAALKTAAAGHAQFVADLAGQAQVRRREILLILTSQTRERPAAQTELQRASAEAIELLRHAGVELETRNGEQTAALLAHTLDPAGVPAGSQLTGIVSTC